MKKVISLALVLVVVLTAFAACTPVEEKILGSWKGNVDLGAGFSKEGTYVLNAGGTGKLELVEDAVSLDIKWSIYEKQITIEIDTGSGSNILQSILNFAADIASDPISYTFELKGDTLTLTKADGTKTTLTRVVAQ